MSLTDSESNCTQIQRVDHCGTGLFRETQEKSLKRTHKASVESRHGPAIQQSAFCSSEWLGRSVTDPQTY